MKVYHDEGDGNTERSVKFFRDFHAKEPGFRPIEAFLRKKGRVFNFELRGHILDEEMHDTESGLLLLSGINCGYGGEGPYGAIVILTELCARYFPGTEVASLFESSVYNWDSVYIDFTEDRPRVARLQVGEVLTKSARPKLWERLRSTLWADS